MVPGVHHNDEAAAVADAHIGCSRTAEYCSRTADYYSRVAARMVEADYHQ